MIYIDPPYNTGKDFVYEDDFAESTDEFFERSNQVDEEGNRLIANTETNGRFHSDWLSMIYGRLKLARNLLKDDGVIFISIDDNEQDNLRKILDEVFGRNNFVANLIWEKKFAPQNDAKWFSENHDHILCYAKNKNELSIKLLPRTSEMNERYKNYDNDPRGVWISDNLLRKDLQKTGVYTITTPNGNKYDPPSGRSWRVSESKFHEMAKDNRIWFGSDGGNVPRIKRFLTEVQDGIKSQTIWKFNEVGHNQEASQELRKLFDGESYFDTPKPVRLLSRIIFLSTQKDDIVLDFFAGSSTTAHAVMQINAEDGCDRKFIMVQLPEQTDEKSDAYKAGYNTISEISKERIRRAGKKILEDNANKEGIENLDIGFRVLKIDTTNMKDVYYTPDALKQADILDLADHIKADRSSEDLLFQVMLDWGLELSLPIELKTVAGKEVFYVAGNSLVACFDDLTFDVVDEVAKDHPLRFVSAEKAIHLDHDKTNIKERFKQLSPDTEVKFL